MPSPTTELKLVLKETFPASREKLFKAWTEPAEMKKWFAPGDMTVPFVEVDLKVGGKYRIGMKDNKDNKLYVPTGVYREILPLSKLVFTWSLEEVPEKGETLVTLEFHEKENGTELVLIHEHFPSVELRDGANHGWIGCLENLRKAL